MRSVVVISPEYPPARGGVAAHTEILAQELSASASVTVLTSADSSGAPSPGGAVEQRLHRAGVERRIARWTDAEAIIAALRRAAPGSVILWQYVPHLYGRGGRNPNLGRVFRQLRQDGRRQVVLAHEIAAPFSLWPHRFLYAWAHRQQWRAMTAAADSIGVSTEAWLKAWTGKLPSGASGKLWLAPSPSSIPRTPLGKNDLAAAKAQMGLPEAATTLGYFGGADAPKRLGWVVGCAERLRQLDEKSALLLIGPESEQLPGSGGDGWRRALGYIPAKEVSRALQCVDLALFPFIDGISERRTTAMAAWQHGRPTLTTLGSSSGPTLRQKGFFEAAAADDFDGFCRLAEELFANPGARSALGEKARETYEGRYGWRALLDKLQPVIWPE